MLANTACIGFQFDHVMLQSGCKARNRLERGGGVIKSRNITMNAINTLEYVYECQYDMLYQWAIILIHSTIT